MSYTSISINKKSFELPEGVNLTDLALNIKDRLAETGDESKVLTEQDGSILIQTRSKDNLIQKLGGVGSAINTHLSAEGGRLIVRFSEGKWMNKILAAGVGIFWWPMAATAGIGVLAQVILPKNILNYIDEYLGNFG